MRASSSSDVREMLRWRHATGTPSPHVKDLERLPGRSGVSCGDEWGNQRGVGKLCFRPTGWYVQALVGTKVKVTVLRAGRG